jgi:uncharacterized protein (DUF58 family)
MIDTSFLGQLSKFNLVIKKRVTSSFTGAQKSFSFGTGTELRDKRKYETGDDIRLIDWNVYARTDKLHIKRFEEEKNLTTHIIVDYSKSMNFGKKYTKFNYSSMLGIGFAYIAMRNNNRFEFSTFSDDLNPVKAKKGLRHLAQIVDYLNKLKTKGASDFSKMMDYYSKTIKHKAMVVIISDFLFDLNEIEDGITRFKNHEIKVIQVLDKEEKDLDIEGDFKLIDSETERIMKTYISKRERQKYIEELNEHSTKVQNIVESVGGKFYTTTTHENIFNVFYNILG